MLQTRQAFSELEVLILSGWLDCLHAWIILFFRCQCQPRNFALLASKASLQTGCSIEEER
jgi:hypothetical protein